MEESVIAEAANGAIALANGTAKEVKSLFHLDELSAYFTWANLAKVITSVVAILIFWVFYRIIRHFVKKAASKTLQKKTVSLIVKAISYCFYVLIVMYVLGLFGIKLSAICCGNCWSCNWFCGANFCKQFDFRSFCRYRQGNENRRFYRG